MRHSVTRLSAIPAVFILAVASVACTEAAATEPNGASLTSVPQLSLVSAGPSARGHVELLLPFQEGTSSYSFVANTDRNGEVKGQFQLNTMFGDDVVVVHGEVTCMTVQPDGTAHIGGVITRIRGAQEGFFSPGDPAVWSVRDNGEGANSPPDMASAMLLGFVPAQDHCPAGTFFLAFEESQRGNIQVTY